MNTHQQSCPLSGCEWCHCQLPHVALTAPNHTSCVAGTSHSTLQQHRFFYLSITVSGWYFPRGVVVHQDGGPVTVFTCGPSTSLWYHTNMTGSSLSISLFLFFFFPSPLQFSSVILTRNQLLALYWQCNNTIQTKTPSLSTFSFFQKVRSIHCAAEVAPTKARICKLLFYTLCLWKKLQIEDTSNREPERFDLTLNAMKLRCIKI